MESALLYFLQYILAAALLIVSFYLSARIRRLPGTNSQIMFLALALVGILSGSIVALDGIQRGWLGVGTLSVLLIVNSFALWRANKKIKRGW